MKRVTVLLAVMTGFVVLSAVAASAAGFALIEQSVKGLGNSFAGGAAVAEDATTIYFNPAGMSRLKGMNATAGVHVILPSA
ncbi:MAG: outer membrane protein transport protein, partial [Desulfuromonadales bacterium]|nr:outer membrane protein transport protein [Desulfuromonadales bacterium]